MEFKVDALLVKIYPTRKEMGTNAAGEVAQKLRSLLQQKEQVNVLFAAAPSQNEFLQSLVEEEDIDWKRLNAFHMDEYIGIPGDAPQCFSNFLKEKIFDKVSFGSLHFLNGNNPDPKAECKRYADLLKRYPTDIVCMGIGENTHIAFNDPHVADFKDLEMVKIVSLDLICRQQQVNDGCFQSLDLVPVSALTLTIPALLNADFIYCMVPGKNKTDAVMLTLSEAISEKYPASILRRHKCSEMFLDNDSAARYKESIFKLNKISKV